MSQVQVSASRSYPIPRETAFDVTMAVPLEIIFSNRAAALPPIRSTDQVGPWISVGQSRVIRLQGPGTMRETLTAVERPHRFTYRIDQLTGPMASLVEDLQGRWAFESAGTGTRITWSWSIAPKGRLGSSSMPLFARMWQRYAELALAELEPILLGEAGPLSAGTDAPR